MGCLALEYNFKTIAQLTKFSSLIKQIIHIPKIHSNNNETLNTLPSNKYLDFNYNFEVLTENLNVHLKRKSINISQSKKHGGITPTKYLFSNIQEDNI